MADELSKEEINKWVDYWFFQIGNNVSPVVSQAKTAKQGHSWKEWQINPMPEETLNLLKAQGAFNEGIGVIVGKVWRGPNAGKYLIFIDCDNKAAIDEICTNKEGQKIPLEKFAEKFIVEIHEDNPDKCHIYFYSTIPFEKKSSDVLEKELVNQKLSTNVPLFEVKGKGGHGIAFCTPSKHKDGYRYKIIGTADPITLDDFQANNMMQHLDRICKKHGLHYLDHNDEHGRPILPMESLYEEDFVLYEGQNRHEGLMRFMESIIKKNKKFMHLPTYIIKDICKAANERKCKPPLDDNEFEKQWKSANEFMVKVFENEGADPRSDKEKQDEQAENESNANLIAQFKESQHKMPVYRISDLGAALLRENVVVTGVVTGVSELVPSWKMIKWWCKSCGGKNDSDRYDKTKSPKSCGFCSNSTGFISGIDYDINPVINQQTILLQDSGLNLSCVLIGMQSDMWKVKPGQKVQALGIQRLKVKFNRKLQENELVKYFELLDIKPYDGIDVSYTDKDVEYFRELAGSVNNFIDEIVLPSFAPHITGNMTDCKLVCIFTLGSQGIDRPFNSILVGPPARGKTQLVEYTCDISHSGNLTTFVNTTIAGLTTETVIDPVSGSRMTKPGILGCYSLAAFTDLNGVMDLKDGKKLMLSLNDALERKVITSGKAGGAQRFDGRCAVLMDSNNFQATWYYDERIDHNLQFAPKSFLSRIDLIGLVPESVSDEHHRQVGKANYRSYRQKQDAIRLHEGDWTDEFGKPRLGFESLRKYIRYIVDQPLPELPDDIDLEDYLGDNYVNVLKKDKEFLIDGRYNRTVTTLARVRARLMFKPITDRSDLEYAIHFVNKCKNIQTVDPKTGEHDANYLLGANSKSEIQREEDINKMNQWVTACHNAMAHSSDGYFSSTDLINELGALPNAKWTDFANIVEHIKLFSEKGRMLMNAQGRYKWLDI